MNAYVAEFVGMVFFTVIILASQNAFAIGAALSIAVYLSKHISGGAFNPVVTMLFIMNGMFPANQFLPFALVQFAGGLVGFGLWKAATLAWK